MSQHFKDKLEPELKIQEIERAIRLVVTNVKLQLDTEKFAPERISRKEVLKNVQTDLTTILDGITSYLWRHW